MSEILFVLCLVLTGGLVGTGYLYWQAATRCQQLQRDIDPLRHQSATSDSELQHLRQVLEEKDRTLAQLRSSLDSVRIELNQRQDTLAATETALSALRENNHVREQELDALRQSITELQGNLDAARSEVTALQQQLSGKDAETARQLATALTLANAAYDALLVVNTDCRVLATNTAAEALFELTTSQAGRHVTEVTRAPALAMLVQDALENAEEVLEEQMSLYDRGYLARAQVIRRGDNTFIGLALQDITQLIRLNRARRDMVANISHELRTPIANIRLIIDGLFHDQDKPKRKDSISSLRAIARETEALLWLVQEMADLSMIESGQAIVRMVDVPLNEVINEALERLQDQLAARHLTLVRHIPETMHVLCDRDLMQRVLMNLLHNAKKWAPPGTTITIGVVEAGDEVVVNVFDQGPGVPDDQVERIFERFYQVDSSRSVGEGTGLGLAICKHIVTAHGGRIWAEGNSTGPGGRFKFTLLRGEDETVNHSLPNNTSQQPV